MKNKKLMIASYVAALMGFVLLICYAAIHSNTSNIMLLQFGLMLVGAGLAGMFLGQIAKIEPGEE